MDWLMDNSSAQPADGHAQRSPSDGHATTPPADGHAKTMPCHDDIEKLAYDLWEQRQRNGVEGSAEQDWAQAEHCLHPGDSAPGQ
jgi:Protein of unknown function (DUF2934)